MTGIEITRAEIMALPESRARMQALGLLTYLERTIRAAEGTARPKTLAEAERELIETTLAASPTYVEAARSLGICPKTLWFKRKQYGI